MDSTSGNRILIVDDEQTIVSFLTRFLTSEGFCVCSAGDGGSALKLLKTNYGSRFAALITDLQMPGVRGQELLKAAHDFDPSLTILVITALDDTDLAVSCMREGAADYILKPFAIDDVIARLRNALEKRRIIFNRNQFAVSSTQ